MRRFVGLLVLLVVLIISSCILLYHLFPNMVSRILTENLNVPTNIEKISVRKDFTTLEGLIIKNPVGSSIKKALTIKEIQIKIPFSHYFSNPIIIEKISLEKVYISIELSKKNTTPCNWNYIIKHIHSEKPEWYSIKRKGLIKSLVLTNVTIEIKQFGKDPQILSPIPRIEFNNINVEEGIPLNEFSKIIVSKMMGSIFSLSTIKNLLTTPLDAFGFFLRPLEPKSEQPGDECPKYSN